jgi:glycosyltransferase involved in cell wall biosynthesis
METSVLFLVHLYDPATGGAEKVFQKMAETLAAKGRRVTVLTSDALSMEHYYVPAASPPPARETIRGVDVIRERLGRPVYQPFRLIDILLKKAGRFGLLLRPLFIGPHHFRTFRAVLRTPPADLVIAGPTPASSIFYGLLYKKIHPTSKLVIFPHMHIQDKLHTSLFNIEALKRADLLFALTDVEKAYLRACGIPDDRIRRLANGVDRGFLEAPRASFPEGRDAVLYLGQEGAHKRIPLLIAAMTRLRRKGIENPLVIAGARAGFSRELDRLIRNLPDPDRARILRLNNIGEERKIALLDSCRVLVNPSGFEAFGLVFLEAWARAKPVIGADIKALKEIIRDGRNGLLFNPLKDGDLEDKILTLIRDEPLAAKMGQAGRLEVEDKYLWENIIENLISVFSDLSGTCRIS